MGGSGAGREGRGVDGMASDGLRAELARLGGGRDRPSAETLQAVVAKARAVSPRELSRELQLVRGTALRRLTVAAWILSEDVRLAASVRGSLDHSALLKLPSGRMRVEAARAGVRLLQALLAVPPARGEGASFAYLQRSFERCAAAAGLRIRHEVLAQAQVRVAASLQRMRRVERGLSGDDDGGDDGVSVASALRAAAEAEEVARRARAVRHGDVHRLYGAVNALSAAIGRVRAASAGRGDGGDGGDAGEGEGEGEGEEWEDAVLVVHDVDEQQQQHTQ